MHNDHMHVCERKNREGEGREGRGGNRWEERGGEEGTEKLR